ncbi:hypothetical protein FKM82_028964 [Ascaphus truei]
MKMQEEQARGTEGKATPVQWGEFHGMRLGESWSDDNDSWKAFTDEDSEHAWLDDEGTQTAQDHGQWWCEDCTVLSSSAEHLGDKSSLEKVFESCFPSFPLPEIQEDVKPLEQFFPELGIWEDQTHTRSAERLWGADMDFAYYSLPEDFLDVPSDGITSLMCLGPDCMFPEEDLVWGAIFSVRGVSYLVSSPLLPTTDEYQVPTTETRPETFQTRSPQGTQRRS